MRLHAQTAIIENGFVHLPETAPWLAEYLHEMTVFPKGKHDDQVDSTAQFLDWFKIPMPHWGIFEYYPADWPKKSSSVANRRPSKPYGPRAPWNGSPNRTNRANPQVLIIHSPKFSTSRADIRVPHRWSEAPFEVPSDKGRTFRGCKLPASAGSKSRFPSQSSLPVSTV